MKKQIVFVGGIHGAGKSTNCHALSVQHGWRVVKQRRQLISVGAEHGILWPEVASRHDELIPHVADRLLDMLRQSAEAVLLVDCHYAIPTSAALRTRHCTGCYMPNLDWNLVERVKQEHWCRFVLLKVDPAIALARIMARPEATHYVNTLRHFVEEAVAENEVFQRLLAHFSVQFSDCIILEAINSRQTVSMLDRFICST
ncbi:ATP-binding protein [Patescibacteria group bacterium]|nr:ATP-binding protein [Patescibacteria group bacterium]MBU1952173.1 ATP-binding protein [Patescibacteria group bacterium]MBU2236213.1 ATP-binding protein [Patescibacteria group bacterium]